MGRRIISLQVKAEEGRKVAEHAPAKMMLPDDWKCEGLALATRLEDNPDQESVLGFLQKVKDCFDKARLKVTDPLMVRVMAHTLALMAENQLKCQTRPTAADVAAIRAAAAKAGGGVGSGGGGSGGGDDGKKQIGKKDAPNFEQLEKKAAMAVAKYIDVGLFEEAACLCQQWCAQPQLARLSNRIMRQQKNDT